MEFTIRADVRGSADITCHILAGSGIVNDITN